MPLQEDPILGFSYLSVEDFKSRAAIFGCAQAVAAIGEDDLILALLAAASRAIDAEVGRDFLSGQVGENHKFDLATRRVKVNRPPLVSLVSYRIRTGAGLVSSFSVAPVTTDGVNNVSFGSIYYNRQENYLELSSLAMAGSMTSTLVSLGLSEPQAEIVYTSLQDVPKQVIAATGYTAALAINESAANKMIAPGLASVKADDVEVKRSTSKSAGGEVGIPLKAKQLLRGLSRIAIG
jgi:hypothetical protein